MKRAIFLFVPLLSLLILITSVSTPQIEASQLPSGDLEINFLNQVGGRVTTVAKEGNYAYIGMGQRLVVLDIQEPTQPVVVGRSAVLPDSIYELTLHNQYAYAELADNLAIFDVSDVANPRLTAVYTTPGLLQDMIISETFLYITEYEVAINNQWQHGGMRVLNISSPTTPVEIGYFDPGESVIGIAKQGQFLYLGHANNSWRTSVVDISNPSNPTEVYTFDAGRSALDMAIGNNHLYLAVAGDGLAIYDLTIPQTPAFVRQISSVFAIGVSLDGSIMYVEQPNSLRLYDVTDPQTPLFLDSYGDDTTLDPPKAVAEGDYVYVAYASAGFQIVDVSDPTDVAKISEYDLFSEVHSLVVDDDYLYVPEGMEGISVVSVNPEGIPATIGYYPQTTFYGAIAARDGYIYVKDLINSTFLIIDATNPSNPILAGQHFLEDTTNQIALEGNYAYTIGNSLRIFDISDPQNPTIFPEWYRRGDEIAVAGGHAFIGDIDVIRIADVSDPMAPEMITSYQMTDDVIALSIANGHLYALVKDSGLHILDVTDVPNPTAVGSLPLDVTFGALFLDGIRLYMRHGNIVSALDISNPTFPTVISHCQTTGGSDIAAKGSQVYVGQSVNGLLILQLESSASLSSFDSQSVKGHAVSSNISITVNSDSGQINTFLPLVLRPLPPLYPCVSYN